MRGRPNPRWRASGGEAGEVVRVRRARGWGPQDGVSALNKMGPESSPALSRSLSLSSPFSPSLSPPPHGGTARRRPPTSREEGSRRRPNLPALDPRLAAPEPCKGVLLPEPHLRRWLQRPELTPTPARGPPRGAASCQVAPSPASSLQSSLLRLCPRGADRPETRRAAVLWGQSRKESRLAGVGEAQLDPWFRLPPALPLEASLP